MSELSHQNRYGWQICIMYGTVIKKGEVQVKLSAKHQLTQTILDK